MIRGANDDYRDFLMAALSSLDGVTTRRMFGCDGFFTRTRLFAFLTDDSLVMKLPEAARARALQRRHVRPLYIKSKRKFGRWIEVGLEGKRQVTLALRLARIAHETIDDSSRPRSRARVRSSTGPARSRS